MKIFLKIIAILLFVFGGLVTLGGTIVMIDKPNDIVADVIMIVIFGITPILGGVLIIKHQRRNKTKIEASQPQYIKGEKGFVNENQANIQQSQLNNPDHFEKVNNLQSYNNNRPSEMADIFQTKALKRPNAFQQLLKINPKINAVIEINNLLGTKYLHDIKMADIQEISTRYKTNLRGSLLKDVKELYTRYLEKFLKDYLLTDEDCKNLVYLSQLLVLQEKEVAELHNKLASEIYKRIFDEALYNSKLGKYNEEYVDKLKKDIRLPNEIADKISYACRQNYLLSQFAIIRKDEKISPDDWNEFNEIAKNLNITLDSDSVSNAKIERMKLNWLIENGELPVKQVSINLPATEHCYYYANIEWLETRRVTKRVNYSGASYRMKIAKGLYYRVGSISPQRITSDELQVIDKGTVYVTNKRILFTGAVKNTNIPLSKILSITPYSDGVGIEKDSGKSPILRVSNNSDILAMIIARVIKDSLQTKSNSEYMPIETSVENKTPLSNNLFGNEDKELIQLIEAKELLKAVKYYKEKNNVGLAEAKKYVDEIYANLKNRNR